jgi:hypothetical protein
MEHERKRKEIQFKRGKGRKEERKGEKERAILVHEEI